MIRQPAVLAFLRLLCVALAVAMVVPAGGYVQPAAAQQAGEGGGLLRFLFRRGDAAKQDRAQPPKAAPRRATQTRRTQPSAVPATPAVEKAENARKVLVVGDFLAGGLAEGLTSAIDQTATVVVVDRSNGSSGLVRDDHYDWPAKIGGLIDEVQPAVVVVMIGSNDRQQMRVDGNREQPRTEAWTKEYERRVTALAKGVRDKGLPLVWVGNLPFKSSAMSSDMVAFNDIYRRIVSDAGGEFVSVWDGFVDETGAFVSTGPDMNGQPAQLRASDGINVTRQGRRKIAFYVEKPLNRLLGTGAPAGVAPLDPAAPRGPSPDGEGPAVIDRTPPVAIDDPELDGGSALLGASFSPHNAGGKSPADILAQEGVAPDPQPGRADDFAMRRPPVPGPVATGAPSGERTTALTP